MKEEYTKEEYTFSLDSGIIVKFAIHKKQDKDYAVELKKIRNNEVIYHLYEEF